MRVILSKSKENNEYDGILVQPETLFDEDWILSKIGNIGTTHTVKLTVVKGFGDRPGVEIKIPGLDEKGLPPMKTKLFETTK